MALHDALLGAAVLGSLLYILIRRQPDPYAETPMDEACEPAERGCAPPTPAQAQATPRKPLYRSREAVYRQFGHALALAREQADPSAKIGVLREHLGGDLRLTTEFVSGAGVYRAEATLYFREYTSLGGTTCYNDRSARLAALSYPASPATDSPDVLAAVIGQLLVAIGA